MTALDRSRTTGTTGTGGQGPRPARRFRLPGLGVANGLTMAVLGVLIVVPAVLILVAAFADQIPRPGSDALAPTLGNFAVLVEAGVLEATMNSLVIGVGGTMLALVIGGFIAFVTARSDAPWRPLLFLIGLGPLFLPSYVGALAWSMLGSPAAGLVNVAFRDLGIPLAIDMYTLTGLVVVLGMYYAPYAFLLVHSAFSMMNPDLEDAAHVHGGSMRKVLGGVTFPLALPAILGSGLLVFTLIFENFPVAQTLGSPGSIETLPTFIYRLMNAFPSRGNEAAALAVVLVAVVLGATLLQRWLISRRSYTTVSGKGVRARRVPLGAWRWPVVAVALVYLVAAIVAPLGALLLTAIRTSPVMLSFGELAEPGAIDFAVFPAVVSSDLFLGSATNSVLVGLAAAVFGTVLAFVAVYLAYRTRSRLAGALEAVSMTPLAVPHIVLGIGLLWTWLILPLPLYGTLAVMVVAFVAAQMPQGFRGLSAGILQTDRDLEDSAVMLGAGRVRAISHVTVPLMKVGLTSTFLLLLMLSMRELTVPIFLYTADTRILSIAIFDEFENGGALQDAAALSLVYCLLILVLSALPRLVDRRSRRNS